MIEDQKMDHKEFYMQHLRCTVCFCVMVDPMALSCGHIFCHFCIETIEQQNNNHINKTIPCPLCKTMVIIPNRKLVHPLYQLISFANSIDPKAYQERTNEIYQEKMLRRTLLFPSHDYDPSSQMWPYEIVDLIIRKGEFQETANEFIYLDFETQIRVLMMASEASQKNLCTTRFDPALVGLKLRVMNVERDDSNKVIHYRVYIMGRCRITEVYPYQKQLRVDHEFISDITFLRPSSEMTMFSGNDSIHVAEVNMGEIILRPDAQYQIAAFHTPYSVSDYSSFTLFLTSSFELIRHLNLQVPGFEHIENYLATILERETDIEEDDQDEDQEDDDDTKLDKLSWYLFIAFSRYFYFQYQSKNYVIYLTIDRQKIFSSRSIVNRLEQCLCMMEKLYFLLHQIRYSNNIVAIKEETSMVVIETPPPVRRSLRIKKMN